MQSVGRYGVTASDLVRLGADEANAFDGGSGMDKNGGGPGSGSSFGGGAVSGDSLTLSMARETQFSLVAYGHIIQGRFIDICCLLVHKLLVKDLQIEMQEAFTELCYEEEKLELLMENDPETVKARTELEASIKRLSESLRRLNKCD